MSKPNVTRHLQGLLPQGVELLNQIALHWATSNRDAADPVLQYAALDNRMGDPIRRGAFHPIKRR